MNLSPSALKVFVDCARCFWLDKVKKLKTPRGIFSTLPNGMDGHIKNYFDVHRVAGIVPPELAELEGVTLYPDQAKLKKWRHWKSTDLIIQVDELYTVSGAIDELLVSPDGETVIIADYKTRGYAYRDITDAYKYYTLQMSLYGKSFREYGFKVASTAQLIYYIPTGISDNGQVKFDVQLIPLPLKMDEAMVIVHKAIECLAGPKPEQSKECQYCNYATQRNIEGGQESGKVFN